MRRGDTEPKTLGDAFAHLTEGGGVLGVPAGEHFWTEGIAQLPPGRLVSTFESRSDWSSWEMHPNGDELVLLLSGRLVLLFEADGERWSEDVRAGQFVVVPRGVWHTADVTEPGTALFITAGDGTTHRGR